MVLMPLAEAHDPETIDEQARSAYQGGASDYPIVVDLDHTLVLTDTLYEHLTVGVFSDPRGLIRAFMGSFGGRAALKSALAREIAFPVTNLPLREDLVAWLRAEASRGREIHLCSAANKTIVEAIGQRLGLFHTVVGSDIVNLKGASKAEHLALLFPNGFVYAGDSRADLAVWSKAHGIILANASPGVSREARRLGKPIEAEFNSQPLTFRQAFKALRVHHWSKNALIFVPLILSHSWNDMAAVAKVLLGLVCLLIVTSASYLLNDIADLDADRQHWSKKNRALASGRLSIRNGFAGACVGLILGLVGAFALSSTFGLALISYLALTLAYSLGLKCVPLLDTLIIGVLFTTRLVMGIVLLSQPLAEWLLTFSVFFSSPLPSRSVIRRSSGRVRTSATALDGAATRSRTNPSRWCSVCRVPWPRSSSWSCSSCRRPSGGMPIITRNFSGQFR